MPDYQRPLDLIGQEIQARGKKITQAKDTLRQLQCSEEFQHAKRTLAQAKITLDELQYREEFQRAKRTLKDHQISRDQNIAEAHRRIVIEKESSGYGSFSEWCEHFGISRRHATRIAAKLQQNSGAKTKDSLQEKSVETPHRSPSLLEQIKAAWSTLTHEQREEIDTWVACHLEDLQEAA